MGIFCFEKKVFALACHSCTIPGHRAPADRTGAILLPSCPLTEAITVKLFVVWAMKTVYAEYVVENEDIDVSVDTERSTKDGIVGLLGLVGLLGIVRLLGSRRHMEQLTVLLR